MKNDTFCGSIIMDCVRLKDTQAHIERLEAENGGLKQESNTWKERAEGMSDAYDCEKEEHEHFESTLATYKAVVEKVIEAVKDTNDSQNP